MFDCLVAGDANVDLLMDGVIALEPGTEKLAKGMHLVLGGSSAITAFNLCKLGRKVAFAGVVGHDLLGRFVEEKLAGGGVDIRWLSRSDTEKTGLTIWHSCHAERAGVTYQGTIAMLDAGDILDEMLKSARHFHVGAYFVQSRLHAQAAQLFARAKALGVTTSIDCNYDPAERWDSNLLEVLEHADVFFPNEDEARAITGNPDTAGAARELATRARCVVVKLGARGVLIVTRSWEFEVAAIPAEVLDTTGAGDSFNAGFLSRFVLGDDLESCAQAGVAAAARSVGQVGGTTAFES
jgi:sugar/nucleoside kinase (ribokinase family)